MPPILRGILIVILALLPASPAAGAARTLSWSSIEVDARLDADARLHVVERQAIVFDGDWNGGERGFRLGPNQRIELDSITRIDPESGDEIELREGDLDRIDHFDWFDSTTLRWRSRLPSDPPFSQQTIVYQLTYSLEGVLRQEADAYVLDHDFAFPDRPGPIDRFELRLELDPVWRAPRELPRRLERTNLAPGRGVILSYHLGYSGEGRPRLVARSVPRVLWLTIFGLSLAILIGMTAQWVVAERRAGRFASPELPESIDPKWIERHVLSLRPEEVGALWDRKVGPPEVAALIARLVAEGKLSSSVRVEKRWWFRSSILELERHVEIDAFSDYELQLIRGLFYDDGQATDTEAIREHYHGVGFSPAAVIRPALERRLGRLSDSGEPRPAPGWRPTARLAAAFVGLGIVHALVRGIEPALGLVGVAFVALFPSIVGWVAAVRFQHRTRGYLRGVLGVVFPALLIWLFCFGISISTSTTGGLLRAVPGLAALALLPIVLLRSFLNWATSRESSESLARRHRLATAREWLIDELASDQPRLLDEWFPYLLAFGLDRKVDRWFGRYGSATSAANRTPSVSTGTSGSTGASGWTGGGGAFGGGGATAAWGAAAATLASGVASPSSGGSGSSGGGGGGSSSGGGSGGGW